MAEVAQSSCIPHTTSSAGAPSAHKQSQLSCQREHGVNIRMGALSA